MIKTMEMQTNGFRYITEARLTRTGIFSGVFHVLSFEDTEIFDPPIVVLSPGKWETEDEAHRAAQEYAVVMADDGALRTAIKVRQAACRQQS